MAALTRNQMSSIHVCKKEAGLDTDQKYRDFLFSVAGVRSCKELSVEGANKVLQAMGARVRPKEVIRKPKFDMSKYLSKSKMPPWEYRVVSDKEWSNFVNYMDEMEKKRIAVVAVLEPDGTKKFKYRPMRNV
jgi:hypothetical protein